MMKPFLILLLLIFFSCKENSLKQKSANKLETFPIDFKQEQLNCTGEKYNSNQCSDRDNNLSISFNKNSILITSNNKNYIDESNNSSDLGYETFLFKNNDEKVILVDNFLENGHLFLVYYINNNSIKFLGKKEITNTTDQNPNYSFRIEKRDTIIDMFLNKKLKNISFDITKAIDLHINEIKKITDSLAGKKYILEKQKSCDLNGDGLKDIVLVFQTLRTFTQEDETTMDSPVYVLINNSKNKFDIYKNKNIIYTFMPNSPAEGFRDIVVKDNFFTIEQQEGGGWYFVDSYTTFKFDKSRKEIVLSKYGKSFIDRREPEKSIPDQIFTPKDFNTISFTNFDAEQLSTLME
ncbi:hypothetical protein [Chryseobacterium sp. JV558]|uniref:hypothetical protein n=1 Tax=Chryseobacterium sp. JV558 TaxID=2663236 RepID=UPI00299D22E9|nr:hypothetical protein [Chryseobacterium sp. JV558]MDW9381891.1 hypothetical protein [Chryseobacterium sp. JV558]